MMDWQPIETAPKGDNLFLVYVPGAAKRKVTMSSGRGSLDKWFIQHGYTVFDDRMNPVRATHWMPLPPPPGTPREFVDASGEKPPAPEKATD